MHSLAILILFLVICSTDSLFDGDGYDSEGDAVGAGIYGGKVQRDANGNIIMGDQYERHNAEPGPLYLPKGGYTDLNKAILQANDDLVLRLLSKDPSLANEISTGGATPLHICGMSENAQLMTRFIIEAGGDMHSFDTYGLTPLHRMASNDLVIGAQHLIDAGVDVNLKSRKSWGGDTPLKLATGTNSRMVSQLLARSGGRLR